MTYPPQPGQWGSSAPPPGPPQPPQGYYPPQGWNPPPPPPQKNNGGLKWLLIAVAVLLVIAISVGVTLFVTRDGSGGKGPTATASPGDIASADDTGPVSIITSDPTCTGWQPLSNALAASQSDGWRNRDPLASSSDWTPQQRAQYETASSGMRSTADQAIQLVKQTPHRSMRELYEQFIAYGRAYADSISSYKPSDDHLSRVNVSISNAISAICDTINQGSALARAAAVPHASPPSQRPSVGNISSPSIFLPEAPNVCADVVSAETSFQSDLSEWQGLDSKLSASQWTSDQRAVQERAADIMTSYANKLDQYGRKSGNSTFEDFLTLASLYFKAYADATPTYTVTDGYLVIPGLRLGNIVSDACRATVG